MEIVLHPKGDRVQAGHAQQRCGVQLAGGEDADHQDGQHRRPSLHRPEHHASDRPPTASLDEALIHQLGGHPSPARLKQFPGERKEQPCVKDHEPSGGVVEQVAKARRVGEAEDPDPRDADKRGGQRVPQRADQIDCLGRSPSPKRPRRKCEERGQDCRGARGDECIRQVVATLSPHHGVGLEGPRCRGQYQQRDREGEGGKQRGRDSFPSANRRA